MLLCENRSVKKDTQAIGYDRTNWHWHRPGMINYITYCETSFLLFAILLTA